MPADEDTPSSSATVAATAEARPDAPPARNAAALDAEVRATMRAEPLSDRYPRHGWGKTLRWLLALAWAAFVAYMYQVGNAIIPLWIDGQTPTGDDIANALLLGRLIPAIQHAPLLALAVPVVVLVALVLLSAAAARDIKKEREFIRDHESWQQDYERKRNALLAAEAHKAATAAHTTARETREQLPELIRQHAGSLKDSTPATPAGPPLDFSLLPEPEHFVGREADLAWVEDRLRQGGTSAIVAAIAGLGGIGKTALAAVAVRKLYAEGRFKDGIAVVSCPGRGDAAGVLRDVLLRFVPQDVSPEATIADLVTLAVNRLSGRDALVVLDNVEPELFIADVLQPLRDAHLTVLLTARQTLPLPPDARHELDLLTESAALDLFAEWYGRANAAALTSAELASARKIVGALGNHTLAVKLAGAQAADLTIPLDQFAAQVAAHPLDLEDQGADVTLALKERLMRSVNALPTDGDLGDVRRFFAALAAFAVPARDADDPDRVRLVPSLEFGRRAAKAVAEALNLPDPDRALNLLVRRALLDKDTDETLAAEADSVRLRMHPLLRELGAELLDDPTRAAASLAIAVFYAEYANEMPDAALTPDAENITGALEWAYEHAPDADRDEIVAVICDGMRQFWRDRARTRDSLRYLPWGIRALEDSGDSEALGYILREYGEVLFTVGDVVHAEQTFAEALGVFRRLGDQLGVARLSEMLGRIAALKGQVADADARYKEAEAVFRQAGQTRALGILLTSEGQLAQARGRLEEAEDYFQQSLVIYREVQDRHGEGVALSDLGQIALHRGRLEEAERYFRQGLLILREVQDRRGEGVVLSSLGQIAQARQHLEEAEDYFQQSLVIYREVRDRPAEGVCYADLGRLAMRRDLLEAADAYFNQALAIDRETQNLQSEGVDLAELAMIAAVRQDLDAAESRYREALDVLSRAEDAPNYATAAIRFGSFLIEFERGKIGEGCSVLQQAIAIYQQMGVPDGRRARELARRLGCDAEE